MSEEPFQRQVHTSRLREKNGFEIVLLASFDIRAWYSLSKVIGLTAARRYPGGTRFGLGADVEKRHLKQISSPEADASIAGGRRNSVPRNVIESHSANMHMIPADDDIERRLKSTRAGNLVHIKGLPGGSHE